MYAIEYSKSAQSYLSKGSDLMVRRILKKIEKLKNNPVPHDAKSIIHERGCFRIRVGSERILYRVDPKQKLILIYRIDKRARAYK